MVKGRTEERAKRKKRIEKKGGERRKESGEEKEARNGEEEKRGEKKNGGEEMARCVSHVFPSQCWHAGSVASQCGWPSIFLSHAPYVAR